MLREMLRSAVRGRVFRRRLPAKFGAAVVYVAPDSQLHYLKPGTAWLDADLLEWAARFVEKDDVVWDIGANVGIFGAAAAGRGGRVMAVEPDPFLANCLLRTRAANPFDFEVLAAAVSDKPGVAPLEIASGGRASNSLSTYAGKRGQFGKSVGRVLVPTVTLDSLLEFSRPAVVKIDVEGAELDVLAGATRVLKEVRPRWFIEVGRTLRPAATRLLHAEGYTLYNALDLGEPLTEASANVLAVPSEARQP
ncbi:FkbM family methyltransferase [Phenylobacterium sp.]|uniref:FkbM family methyltransferase n=1 Tax=Phenylobacterium sp. TaxID=1871053 RepID=UPI002FE428F2